MDGPGLGVIEPKLMPPRVHPGVLRRARLLEMLADDAAASFTVLNAAVGYGKTTLVRSWCVERPEAVIWVTLDSADDDPVRLWAHLATAVERLGEGFGRRALSCLAVRGATVETAVDELMNGLVAYGRRVTIVLDDLHTVRSEASVRSIAQAIERLPANARLVASTRSDPAIGLARLRARRALTEVRARELAFTVDETRELVVREGIGLSSESVELLVERTEGWPAGLYLAALWLRDLEDPDGGVREFAGSARQVGDYLADEVLTALAPETRDFLVRTSVLGASHPSCATRSSGARTRPRCSRTSRARTCSWSRSTPAGSGTAITICSARFCSSSSGATTRASCAAARRLGVARTGSSEEAIEYAAAAGDAETVAELLVENAPRVRSGAGGSDSFSAGCAGFPPSCSSQHPSLPAGGAVAAALLARPGGRGSAVSGGRGARAAGAAGAVVAVRSRRAWKSPVRR